MTRGQLDAAFCRKFALALALGAAACGPDLVDGSVTSQGAPIFGGVADTTDEAVMALVHQMGLTGTNGCTGTTIAKVGASGIFLTAGHCVVQNDGMGHVLTPVKLAATSELYVIPGPDWAASLMKGLYYGTTAVTMHPQYDGTVQSRYDLALVRFAGATASTPVIPALTPVDDGKLTIGSTFTLVGFGKTEANAMNTQRRKVDRVIETLNGQQFLYDQTDLKGACAGDSGGPAIVSTSGGPRVAGVTSFGDQDCTQIGVSVRAGPAAALIQAFIDGTPTSLTCGECTLASVAPGNQCVNEGVACGGTTSPCGKFIACATPCADTNCVTRCQQMQPAGAIAYDAMVTCQCGGTCEPACRTNQACAPYLTGPSAACGGASDPRPACTSCLRGSCCNEAAACAADATCSACLVRATSSCRVSTAFATLNACTAKCAGAPCSATTTPPPPTDGGTTPPGVTGDGGGCGCAAAPAPDSGALAGVLLVICAGALARRRKTGS